MRRCVWLRRKQLKITLCRIYLFVYLIFNERTQGTALAWREGLRRPLASKVLQLLLKPFQKVLNSRQAAQTAELFGITQKPQHLRISRTPAEHPATPGRFPAGFCMRKNCLRHGDFTHQPVLSSSMLCFYKLHTFTLAYLPFRTSAALFAIFFKLTPSPSLSPFSHVSRRGSVWFGLALQEGCAS